MKQIVTVERLTSFVREHEIIRVYGLRVPRPHSVHGPKDYAVPIEWHLALSRFRFHVVELVVVDTFNYDEAIVKDVTRNKLSLT